MATIIDKLKDRLNNYIYPITSTNAVYSADGTIRLDDKLAEIEAAIPAITVADYAVADSVVLQPNVTLSDTRYHLRKTTIDGKATVTVTGYFTNSVAIANGAGSFVFTMKAGLIPAANVYITCFSTDNVPAETRASLFVIRPGSGNFEFVQSAGITNLPALSTTYFNVTYCC